MSKLCERDLCTSAYSYEEALPIGLRTMTTPRGYTVRCSSNFEVLRNLFHCLTYHTHIHLTTSPEVLRWIHRMRLPVASQMWAHAASCSPYWASNETQNRCSPINRKAGLSRSPNSDAGSLCPERRSPHPFTSLASYWTNPACLQHRPAETGDESRILRLCLANNRSCSHWQFFSSI